MESAWRGLLVGFGAVGTGLLWTFQGLTARQKMWEFVAAGIAIGTVGTFVALHFNRAYASRRGADDPIAVRRLLAGTYKVGLACLLLAIFCTVTAIPIGIVALLDLPFFLRPTLLLPGIVAGAAASYLAGAYLGAGQCPKCLRFRAARVLASRLLGVSEWTEGRYETVAIREGMFQTGRVLANAMLPRIVHVTQAEYENRCACRRCGHEWVSRSIRRASM